MANYNKIILVGNLTRDPQLSFLPSQTPVVEIGLAVNRRWRSKEGEQREETCFIDCRAYGKQAETINQYMKKGRPLLVEGRLQLDSWQSQDGQKRSKHRVIIENFQFMGGGGAGGGQGGQGAQGGQGQAQQQNYSQGQAPPQQPQQQGYTQQGPPPPPPDAPDDIPGGDDIPF